MNKRLDIALEAARQKLDDDAQDQLAMLVEEFVDSQTIDPARLLTPEQLADLDRRLAAEEPDEDPALVRSIFERHGIKPAF